MVAENVTDGRSDLVTLPNKNLPCFCRKLYKFPDIKRAKNLLDSLLFVPRTGLEPARPIRAPAPQAGVSTDFTTWARHANIIYFTI